MVILKKKLKKTARLLLGGACGALLVASAPTALAQEQLTEEQIQQLMAQFGQGQPDPAAMEAQRQQAIEQQRLEKAAREEIGAGNANVTDAQENAFLTQLGALLAEDIPFRDWNFSQEQLDVILASMKDTLQSEPTADPTPEEYLRLGIFLDNRTLQNLIPVWRAEHAAFFDALEANSDINKTDSGLYYEVLEAGSGPEVTPTSVITAHYHGTLPNDEVFDSSLEREPIQFDLGDPTMGLVEGFREGLLLGRGGSTMRLYIPAELAYRERGAGGGMIPPGSPILFEIQILDVQPGAE